LNRVTEQLWRAVFAAAVVSFLTTTSTSAADAPTSAPGSYPLDFCIVMEDMPLADEMVVERHGGREVRLCCATCVEEFQEDTAGYLQLLDDAIIASQLPAYPLGSCVVSGTALDGKAVTPINHLIANRLVRLCSADCQEKVAADPTSFLRQLDAAVVKAQVASYPADTCPISGEKLGSMGDPYDYVHAGRLVRFCCGGCIDSFNENPQAALLGIYGKSEHEGAAPAKMDGHEGHDHSEHKHGGNDD